MDLTSLTVKTVHQGLVKKEFSCEELVESYLVRIKKLDKDLGAYLSLVGEESEDKAEKVDEKIKKGKEIGILEGIPYCVKDNILIKGQKATAGSKILEDYQASYSATAIVRLEEVGTIALGKTNLDEYGMGASTENSSFQPTKNPWDKKRVPGGSSGGSAAAVTASMSTFGLGSDTGGSIRQPASFCGVVGLKPTYGRVSRYGLVALASSFDQIGPITKNVEDAALVLQAMAGKDDYDSTTHDYGVEDYFTGLEKEIKGMKIGVIKEYFQKGLDTKVAKVIQDSVEQLESMGAKIQEISLPSLQYALPVYYLLMPSEASANLARYDGIRYGLSQQKSKDLISQYGENRAKGFGDEVRRRIMLGTYALSAGYYDQYYLKAKKVQKVIRQEFQKVFNKIDCLVGPTTPTTAFKMGDKVDDPLAMYLSDIYTVAANITGVPALSLPVGLVDGLPVGLQIMGDGFQEGKVLNLAYQLEQSLNLQLKPTL